jgi:hypothetical protein
MAQNLFRRHRGGAAGGGGTRETSAVDETYNDGGGTDENNNNNNNNIATNEEEEDGTAPNNGNIMMTSLNHHDVENPETSIDTTSDNNNATSQQQEEDEENNNDEIQELVVRMPPNHTYRSNNSNNNNTMEFPNWTLNEDEINTRREAIRTEVERMQRNNCIHFAVLCLVPTSLLLIVLAAILSEDGECSGDGLTVCEREPRTFVNAFTTRCICDAVGSVASMIIQDNGDGGVGGDVVGEMGATTGEETP